MTDLDKQAAEEYGKEYTLPVSELVKPHFLAGCKHKSKETEKIAIEFASYMLSRTKKDVVKGEELITNEDLFKKFMEERNR